MANDLQAVADIAIMESAIALRNMSRAPLMVSRDLDGAAAEKNDVIQVPVWPSHEVTDVVPGRGNEEAAVDLKARKVPVVLDQWKQTKPFMLTDKEMAEIETNRVVPQNMLRGVIAMADIVDAFITTLLYQASFSFVTAGSPAAVADIVNLRRALNKLFVPRDNRRNLLISDDLDAEFLSLPVFHQANTGADGAQTQAEGEFGRKFGFNIATNGQMPTHTKGDAAGWNVNGAVTAKPSQSGGTEDVALEAGSGNFAPGDLIQFANHSQVYAVVAWASPNVTVAPTLRANLANDEAVAYASGDPSADHAIGGLGFHEMAMAFATRPLQTQTTPGVIVSQATDRVSGLSLRVQLEYVNRSLEWSMDILYGGKVIYPEMIARLRD